MLKKIKKNKLVFPIILCVFTYIGLCGQKVIAVNNLLSFLIFFFVLAFYLKVDWSFKNKYCRASIIFSIIISILLVIGRIIYNFRYLPAYSFWREFLTFKSIIYLVGNFGLIYSLLISAIPKLIDTKVKNNITLKKHPFLIPFIIIFVCYIPYFIIYYPGILSGDSLSELNMILGNTALSDHHTVLHVVFMSIPYNIGYFITHDRNISIAFISLVQMGVMASIFASFINFINKRGASKCLVYGSIAFFALTPMHGFYSITMWKDIIFSGSCLLLCMELYKLLEKKEITLKNSYTFILVSLLTIFFRNNAIYMYCILTLVSLYVFRKQLKVIIPMLLLIFGVYCVVKGPVYNYFKIETSSSAEYIAIPLQQIGRMAYKDVKFTKEESMLINKLIPLEVLKESYNPEIVDNIKFHKEYNAKVFDENKGEYLKLWFNLCLKHPGIAVESYLTSTLGYWYPNVEYWTSMAQIDENNLGVYQNTFLSKSVKNYVTQLTSRTIPLIGNTWCMALCFYLILLSGYITVKRRGKKYLYLFVPVFGIWLTMMVATPVFAEFRYVYSAFTCLPLLITIPYLKIGK